MSVKGGSTHCAWPAVGCTEVSSQHPPAFQQALSREQHSRAAARSSPTAPRDLPPEIRILTNKAQGKTAAQAPCSQHLLLCLLPSPSLSNFSAISFKRNLKAWHPRSPLQSHAQAGPPRHWFQPKSPKEEGSVPSGQSFRSQHGSTKQPVVARASWHRRLPSPQGILPASLTVGHHTWPRPSPWLC